MRAPTQDSGADVTSPADESGNAGAAQAQTAADARILAPIPKELRFGWATTEQGWTRKRYQEARNGVAAIDHERKKQEHAANGAAKEERERAKAAQAERTAEEKRQKAERKAGDAVARARRAEERRTADAASRGTARSGSNEGSFPCTDTGNAERLVAKYGAKIRYCAAWKSWLVWDGKRWRRDVVGRVHYLAKKIARSIYGEAQRIEDKEIRASVVAWAKKSEARERRAALVMCAQSEPAITVEPTAFDCHPMLLNVENGTIDLKTGELRDHDPKDMLTKLAPVTYTKGATAPTFERFIARILPDAEVRTFVQRFFGCCLSGDVSDRVFVFLWGTGRNGKSVLLRIFRTTLGDYAIVGAPDLLMVKQGETTHPCEIADLFGARLVCCQEVPKDRRFNEQRIKELTGNEGAIKGRGMNENFWGFAPTFKLAIAGNHQPRVIDDTDSIWDRLRKVPFNVRIPDEEVDKHLFEKLWAESSGVLAWMVAGCLDWRAHGLPPPKAVATATETYRTEEDTIGRYIADCCVLHPDGRATAKALADEAKRWCDANDEPAFKSKPFAERLKSAGCTPRRTNKGRGWQGIRLLQPDEVRARDAEAGDTVTGGDATSGSPPQDGQSKPSEPQVTSPSVTCHPEAPAGDGDGSASGPVTTDDDDSTCSM